MQRPCINGSRIVWKIVRLEGIRNIDVPVIWRLMTDILGASTFFICLAIPLADRVFFFFLVHKQNSADQSLLSKPSSVRDGVFDGGHDCMSRCGSKDRMNQ